MTPTIQAVIPTAEAYQKFAESIASDEGAAKSEAEIFMFLVHKVTKEYKQFDFNTFVYHAKPYAITNEKLADYFTKWINAMSDLKKIARIPALIFDHESYVLVG